MKLNIEMSDMWRIKMVYVGYVAEIIEKQII
jgi:hypothetical protein